TLPGARFPRVIMTGGRMSAVPRQGRRGWLTSSRRSLSLSGILRLAKFSSLLSVVLAACSPKTYALRQVADAISSTSEGSAVSRDDDPELVRDAVPFALKIMESLADRLPDH